jgi:phosphoglucomutase
MDAVVKKRIEEWTRTPFDTNTINEIKNLTAINSGNELTDRFYTLLEFGTGGLRGVIGAGTNRMNIYTVGMATQGLAEFIKSKNKSAEGVVIARDSRRMSEEFAREAASILAGNDIRVFYFKDIAPTPACSFAIRELRAASGIVITASHNPPEYNGYKVYWDDGGQVTPPYDKEIIGKVKKIDSIIKIKKIDFDEGKKTGMIKIIGNEIIDSYRKNLENNSLRKKSESKIKIVYSPLHGSGYKIIPDMFKYFGFTNISIVKEQEIPDGNFPTVKYPNPEEKDAMKLSLDLAEKINADIILATDPDADRMGVGFKDNNGKFILINGNQIGTMLEYYLLTRLKEAGRLPGNGVIIKTIVTTDLQAEIANSFACDVDNVLTGFKWIAKNMKEYEESGSKKFIFGGEESYGYLPVDFVRDKDSISACYYFAEMADWLAGKGESLFDFLNKIYLNYKLYTEDLHSLTLKGIDGMDRIKKIMTGFRLYPPAEFCGISIEKIADIDSSQVIDTKTKKAEAINIPKSNVLQFFLQDGSKITMRPSGTEPKIKFYFSVSEKADKDNIEKQKLKQQEKIDLLKKDLIQKIERIK